MAHPKDDELIPVGTIVRIRSGVNAGKKAKITSHSFLKDGKNFLNYMGTIEGRKGGYALYHDNLEVIDKKSDSV